MKIHLDSPQDVARLVRAARKAEHLRQDDAAGAMGVSDVFLWKLERGLTMARLDKVLQVFRGIGINLLAEESDEAGARYQALASVQPARTKKKKRQTTKKGTPA